MNEKDHKIMEDDDDFLALSLFPPVSKPRPLQPQPQSLPLLQPHLQSFPSMQALFLSQSPQLQQQLQQQFQYQLQQSQNPSPFAPLPLSPIHQDVQPPQPPHQPHRLALTRRNQTQALRPGKSETIPVLFPWPTPRRATMHSLDYLLSNNITTIKGDVQCKRCDRRFQISYNLQEEYSKLWKFIAEEKSGMKDRAPKEWENPEFLDCKFCDQKGCVKPPMAEKKREINWLFLLLGRFLGCLTLDQLKYFCKHSRNHRTGAKNGVLYLTYIGLCKQLDPSGPFDALD